ncbi:hypothetical protein P5673_016885 [Acropora cervicornis]|uniref:Uncharacterized protein n=1 Tax=Acropora cervicornis TaxID=6130 RepID=A0AAD9V429_ACRCE|nr:hypothetical protein P5673_016885 [Acropora cervicornis]
MATPHLTSFVLPEISSSCLHQVKEILYNVMNCEPGHAPRSNSIAIRIWVKCSKAIRFDNMATAQLSVIFALTDLSVWHLSQDHGLNKKENNTKLGDESTNVKSQCKQIQLKFEKN